MTWGQCFTQRDPESDLVLSEFCSPFPVADPPLRYRPNFSFGFTSGCGGALQRPVFTTVDRWDHPGKRILWYPVEGVCQESSIWWRRQFRKYLHGSTFHWCPCWPYPGSIMFWIFTWWQTCWPVSEVMQSACSIIPSQSSQIKSYGSAGSWKRGVHTALHNWELLFQWLDLSLIVIEKAGIKDFYRNCLSSGSQFGSQLTKIRVSEILECGDVCNFSL